MNKLEIKHHLYEIKGYKVLFIKNISTPNISTPNINIKSIIGSGYINETEHNLGINHLLEHTLVNGYNKCDTDCITYMNKKGIFMNASTGLNLISYYASGLNEDLSLILNFVINSTLNKSHIVDNIIKKEKTAVLNELLENSNDITTSIWHIMFTKFYKYYGLQNYYNYKQQIKNLETLNRKELNDFIDKFYNNILFVISGNFNDNIVFNLLNEFLPEPEPNVNLVKQKNNYINCLSNETGLFFNENENTQNTIIITAFGNNNIKNTIHNNILLNILSKYLKIFSMKILRGIEHLVYGIDIDISFNSCGVQTFIMINVSNENAKEVFLKFIDILNDCKNDIDNEILIGIKKGIKFWNNSKNEDEIISFYENLYIDKIYNNNNDLIIEDINEYIQIYLDINTNQLKDMFNELFDIDKMLTVYSSQKSMH